jgi:hypothetical protein
MLTKLQHTLEYRRKPDEQLCEHLNVKRCSLEGGVVCMLSGHQFNKI